MSVLNGLCNWFGIVALVMGVAACSLTPENLLPDRRPDYRQSRLTNPLEIPPDLTASTLDDTLVVPELIPASSARFSDYASERKPSGQLAAAQSVLPTFTAIKMERQGEKRWLVAQQPPEVLWPRVREFWLQNGLALDREDPRIGLMETQWAENRADIPEDGIRAILKRVLDFAYSAPTRDKFRTRLERVDEGTEIYLTHYGMIETVVGHQKENPQTRWQPRPSDPELVTEMLNRLMLHLGAPARAEQLAQASTPLRVTPTTKARLGQTPDGQTTLIVDATYDQTWRMVGLALESNNFVIEDQDRRQGRYAVEYRLPEADPKPGLLSRIAFWRDTPPPQGIRYQVRLARVGEQTFVVMQDAQGQPDNSAKAQQILELLLKTLSPS